jgi:hypothetical protein
MPMELRRSGRKTKMLIEGSDPFATAKPDARLITRERRTTYRGKMDSSSRSLWLIGPFWNAKAHRGSNIWTRCAINDGPGRL